VSVILGRRHSGACLLQASRNIQECAYYRPPNTHFFWSLSERPTTLQLPLRGGPEAKSPHRLSHTTALVTRNVERRPPWDNLPGNQTTENDTSGIVATLGFNTSGTADCTCQFESPGSRATIVETAYYKATIGHNPRSTTTGSSTTNNHLLEGHPSRRIRQRKPSPRVPPRPPGQLKLVESTPSAHLLRRSRLRRPAHVHPGARLTGPVYDDA